MVTLITTCLGEVRHNEPHLGSMRGESEGFYSIWINNTTLVYNRIYIEFFKNMNLW